MKQNLKQLKLEVMKAEIEAVFTGVSHMLEQGVRFIIVAEELLAKDLAANQLRNVGALVKVCGAYGATVVFSPSTSYTIFDRIRSGEVDEEAG